MVVWVVVGAGDSVVADEAGDSLFCEVGGDLVAFFFFGEDVVAAAGEYDDGLAGWFSLGWEGG